MFLCFLSSGENGIEQKPKPFQTQSLSHPRKAGLSVSVPYIFRLLLHTAVSRWKFVFSAEAEFLFQTLIVSIGNNAVDRIAFECIALIRRERRHFR